MASVSVASTSSSKTKTPVTNIKKEISLNPDKCGKLVARYKRSKLDAQAFVDATDPEDGWSPLHEVMRSCQGENILDLVKYMVETHPAIIETQDVDGNLPIHVLPQFSSAGHKHQIQLDQLEARRYLLAQYPESITIQNKRGKTPLAKAILFEYNILVQSMLDDDETLLREPDEDGKLPLDHALENFSISTVKMFLEKSPDDILTIGEFPKGDTEERQELLAAIGHAVPETFATEPNLLSSSEEEEEEDGGGGGGGQWQLSSNLIHQFLSEAKLEQWGQDVIWRMMQSSVHRHRQGIPQKMEAVVQELGQEKLNVASLKVSIAKLEEEVMQQKIAHQRTIQELKVARAIGETSRRKLQQHDILAQEQEAKYLELAMKVQSLQEARNFNAEGGYLAQIDSEKWTEEELKAVLESLLQRLHQLLPEHTKWSMAHIAASYLVLDEVAEKELLIDAIEALNQELLEL